MSWLNVEEQEPPVAARRRGWGWAALAIGIVLFAAIPFVWRWWSLGRASPRLYLATDRDPSWNLGSPLFTIFEPASLSPLFSSTAGDYAVLTPDHSRLYLASLSQITGVDLATGRELWQAPLTQRMAIIGGVGPSGLGLAPDGSTVYVLSYDGSDSATPPWLQEYDAATGQRKANVIPLTTCLTWDPAILSPSTGTRLYVVCEWVLLTINARSQAVEHTTMLLDLAGGVSDALLSRDERTVYLLTAARQQVAFDLARSSLTPVAAFPRPSDARNDANYASLALSPDGKTLLVLELIYGPQSDSEVASALFFYDTRTWTLQKQLRINQPLQSDALALSSDGRTVYSASGAPETMPFGADRLVEIDAATGQITAEYPHPSEHILRLWLMP